MSKRNSDIANLFRKHETNKIGCSSRPVVVVDSAPPDSESDAEMEDAAPNPPSPQQPAYDHHFLPHDPGQRIPISEYDVNEQDDVRRGYIKAGLMALVALAKDNLRRMRSNGWEGFLAKVTLFCNKHGIEVPSPEENYVAHGRSHRYYEIQTNDDRYRREVYLGVLDQIIQELDNRFDEVNTELLTCMAALNPSNSFASYDAQKVMRLAQFYPDDISSVNLIRLEFQLDTFIHDMRKDDRFKCINHLGELSVMLVETKKHVVYDLVYTLLKLILILPVATASVERVFSAMSLVKDKLRNSMGDKLLNHCLVTFIERDVFLQASEDDMVEAFMAMRRRRVKR